MENQLTMDQMKLQDWEAEACSCKTSGLTVRQWCEKAGISPKTYYYHQRKVRESRQAENRITLLNTRQLTDKIEILSDDIHIWLPAGCSAESLQLVLKVLKDVK